jgi:Trypsin-like peptidase domain
MSIAAALFAASLAAVAVGQVQPLLSYFNAPHDDRSESRDATLSGEDQTLYSGVGALHCVVGDEERIVTAFLVGAFDVVVTVAHAFETGGGTVEASQCTFINTDADGQVVERIPVAEYHSRWIDDPSARGQPREDIAVARLEHISDYAQRTLAFARFDGNATEVMVVAYQSGHGGEWIKGKVEGLAGFATLPDAHESIPGLLWAGHAPQPTASGAPVIDAESGVVIGVNQGDADVATASVVNLLVIDEWLTHTILSYAR